MRNSATSVSWKAGLVGGLLLALSPALAVAQQTPYATGVLYEVREDIVCNPGGPANPLVDPMCAEAASNGFGTRIADATLIGGENGFPGGIAGPTEFSGGINVEASSILNRVDWTGPAHGKIVLQTANGTVLANMAGQLDLSLAGKGLPLAPISGKWHGIRGFDVGGSFSGVFEIPFPCGGASPNGYCYLENGGMVPIEVPFVKLVVAFYNN
jgi:hypothetical protein